MLTKLFANQPLILAPRHKMKKSYLKSLASKKQAPILLKILSDPEPSLWIIIIQWKSHAKALCLCTAPVLACLPGAVHVVPGG